MASPGMYHDILECYWYQPVIVVAGFKFAVNLKALTRVQTPTMCHVC